MSWFKSKYTTWKEYFTNQDNQQKLKVFTSFGSESFKIVMASLLAVFVPQGCPQTIDKAELFSNTFPGLPIPVYLNGTHYETQLCSFKENFSNLIDYNSFVLAFNFVTLCYFIYLYYIEINREKWMIKHFDYDNEKADDDILELKTTYPTILNQLQVINTKYMKTYKYLFIIYIANFLFSSVLVLHYYYLDFRTITALLTNFILCLTKITTGKTVSNDSFKNNFAISFYNIKHLGFNTIDKKLTTITIADNTGNTKKTLVSILKNSENTIQQYNQIQKQKRISFADIIDNNNDNYNNNNDNKKKLLKNEILITTV